MKTAKDKKFDALSESILDILREDWSLSNRAVARKLGVAEATVASRLQRLDESGAMKVVAQWRLVALGFNMRSLLFVDVEPGGSLEAVKAGLSRINDVHLVADLLGGPRLYVLVGTRDAAHLVEVISEEIGAIPGLVIRENFQILDVKKCIGGFSANLNSPFWELPLSEAAPSAALDTFDLLLVEHLQTDARVSNRQLARELDVSETKVRRRLARLRERGLLQFQVLLNRPVSSAQANAMLMLQVRPAAITRLAEIFAREPSVTMVSVVSGSYQLIVHLSSSALSAINSRVDATLAGEVSVLETRLIPITGADLHRYNAAFFEILE